MDKISKIKLMQRASKMGDVKQLQEVLDDPEIQESINRRSGTYKHTALHEACIENQPYVIDTLLNCDAIEVDTVDSRNWTPLCYAVDNGNIETVKKLISKGANVKHVLNNGDTPLHIGAMKCHINICKALLEHGADIKATNYNQWTPLHVASGEGEFELVRLFLENKAPVDMQTTYGDTSSNMAARTDNEDILRLLKKQQADFNMSNNNGESPIHSAAMGGHALTLKYLLQNGADIMSVTDKNLNIFHLAAKNGHTEVFYTMSEYLSSSTFKKLLEAKTECINGMWVSTIGCGIILSQVTSLHLASIEGHSLVVKLLIQAGADKIKKDANDRTALELVTHYKPQMQQWDMDNIQAVLQILEKGTAENLQEQDEGDDLQTRACSAPPSAHPLVLKSYDSDYHSTSSVTTEDMESNIGDLEDCIRQLEVGNTNPKHVHRKKRALKRQIERSFLSDREKADIYHKLESLEKSLNTISEKGVSTSKQSKNKKETLEQISCPVNVSGKTAEKIANKFRANFTTLLRELRADDHIHFLFQQGAIELNEIEKIESCATEEEKVKILLYTLFGKPTYMVWTVAFVESLENCEQTSHLAALLTD